MATTAVGTTDRYRDPISVEVYSLLVLSVFLALTVPIATLHWSAVVGSLEAILAFALVAALADAMRVKLWNAMSFSVSLPVTLAAAMMLLPWQAGLVAFLGSFDLGELRREVPFPRALFNRAEVGIAVFAASSAFHIMAPPGGFDWPAVLVAAGAMLLVDFTVNTALVVYPVAILNHASASDVLRRMFSPKPLQSVATYVGLGLCAPLVAEAWKSGAVFGLATFLLPLGIAGLVYRQAQSLREAAEHMDITNRALVTTLERIADERRDERLAISGELHDEVLPSLFKVHLMGQVLRQDLSTGKLLQLDDDLPELLEATDCAQTAVRDLVRDLRRSPLGRDGLVSTIRLLARNLEATSAARFDLRLEESEASQLSQLIAYQVAREAMTNAAKYSRSSSISVRLQFEDGLMRLVVADDGVGFDPRLVDRQLHFGLQLMHERVEAAGGRLVVDSLQGRGTRIAMTIPPRL